VIEALAVTLALTVSGPSAKPEPPERCRDNIALMLWDAGFRGERNKIAWAITWRESKHRNLDESSPWYSGALGMWQIQTSAHSGKPWWSRQDMVNPERQSRIVYLHMTNKGRNWSPWGLNTDGTGLDVSQYGGWSSWQHYHWIWAPYQQGRALYPDRCAR
jgi:hypothetical protein